MENPSINCISLLREKNTESTRSVNINLALTEENLDYLLRQEYTLPRMGYKADKLTVDALDDPKNIETLKDSDKNVIFNEAIDDIILDEKMDVEEENVAFDEFSMDQNEPDIVLAATKSGMELSEFDNKVNLVSKNSFRQNEYRNNFEFMLEKIMIELKPAILDLNLQGTSKDLRKKIGEKGTNRIVFKMLNLMNISRAISSHKILFLNCNINSVLQVKSPLQTFNGLNLFGNKNRSKEMKIKFPVTINAGMYQSLIQSIQSLLLKEHIDLNETAKSNELKVKSFKKKNKSRENLALPPTLSENITIEDNLDSQLISGKICFRDIENIETFKNKIIELDSYDTGYASYTETVVPAKSNLKRKIPDQADNKKNKLKKSGLKFTNVTTFYFERSQGFSSIPTKGGSTLGMLNRHFYISTVPVDEYEYKKIQRSLPKRKSTVFHRKTDAKGRPKAVQALSLNQRIDLLESSEVQIEVKEEDDCAYIRSSRASAGCDCRDYCDPDICSCSLAGIECQVDRPNFPCGCSKENCRNLMGRNEYNHNKVKSHFNKTIKKIKLENRTKMSKRKQASPSKIFISSFDINTDVDMIQV